MRLLCSLKYIHTYVITKTMLLEGNAFKSHIVAKTIRYCMSTMFDCGTVVMPIRSILIDYNHEHLKIEMEFYKKSKLLDGKLATNLTHKTTQRTRKSTFQC